jgi:IS5 family transposase
MKQQMSLLDGWMVGAGNKQDGFLDKVNALLDFAPLEGVLAKLERGTQGRPPHSAMLMFRLCLLQMFYNLSDPEVETQAADRLSFRKFLGLSLTDKVPDETSLVRFRQKLAAEGIDQELFGLVNGQLEQQGFIVKRATLIDATLVRAATANKAPGAKPLDPDASYTKKAGTYLYGYKVHLAVDADHTLIRKVALSTAKVHESNLADEMIPPDESLVLADKAYDSMARRARLGKRYAIMRQSYRYKKVTAADEAINRLIKPIRARIEKVFGYWKHWMGYTRVRYRGLRANLVELHLRAIAYNLLRVSNLG